MNVNVTNALQFMTVSG